jgi:hypothetical protein
MKHSHFVVLLLLLFFGQARLFAANYDGISVQEIPMTSDLGIRTDHGYIEYRFRVTNRDTKTHTVGLEIPKNTFSRHVTSLSRSANSVDVPPQSTVILRLLQPPVPIEGNDEAQVIIDGRYQRDPTPFRKVSNHLLNSYSHETANILTSKDVSGDLRDLFQKGVPPEKTEKLEGETEITSPGAAAIAAATSPYSGSGTPQPPELMSWSSNVPVEEWSDYWLAYTRFDAVILTSSEWRELREQHAGIFDALRKFVETGGILGIVGTDWNPPKEWLPDNNSLQKYQAVLGFVYVIDKNHAAAKPFIQPFRELVLENAKLWRDAIGNVRHFYGGSPSSAILSHETTLLASLPVVAGYGVNIKLVMVLIVVFAVLIGPVNIYALSLIKRRIWLFWTVPLTSLVASFLVLGASLFQEGFLRQSSSATYTILDQRREEAITFGYVGFYSTLTPRGILFAPETEATACIERGYGNAKSLELHILAGGNQFLSRGWISARIPSYFAVRKAQSQRKERLTFDWEANPPTITNGFGVDIKELSVCSPKGELLIAHNIKAGQKIPLTVSVPTGTISESSALNELHQAYSDIIQSGPKPFLSPNRLPAGSYLAEMDAWNPFVEEGLDKTTPYQNKTSIFGLFE